MVLNVNKLLGLRPCPTFLSILLGNLFFFAIFAYILPITFEDNDDVLMLLFASGKYTGTPEAHLVFINYIYGFFVSTLYSITTKIEWYTVLFSILHIVSLSVILREVLEKNIAKVYKLLFLFLFYAFEIRLIISFQFTTTAALTALSGSILLLRTNSFEKMAGAIVLIIASLIRFEACILVLTVVAPVFVFKIFESKRLLLKTSVYLLISLFFILFCKYVDYQIYNQNVTWSYYQQYNMYRGKINDNPNKEKILNDLPQGVSATDYRLLLTFMPDPQKINTAKIKLIYERLKQLDSIEKWRNIVPTFYAYSRILALALVFLTLLFYNNIENSKRTVIILSLFLFLTSIVFVSLEGKFKYRVFLSAFIPLFFVVYHQIGNYKSKILSRFTLFVGFLFVSFFSFKTYELTQERICWRQHEYIEQKTLLNNYLKDKNNSIVPFGADLSIDFYPAFQVSKHFNQQQIFFSGWASSIPFNAYRYNSYLDLINRHALFFEKKNISKNLALILSSILHNHGIKASVMVESQSENYAIIKIYTN